MNETPAVPTRLIHMNDTAPQSEPFPVQTVIVAVIAAVIAPVLWVGCYLWFKFAYIGAVLIGFLIGFAIRFAPRSRHRIVPILAIGLTILAALAGYVWIDQAYNSHHPTFLQSITFYFRDIQAIIFTGIGCYVSYTAATRNT